MNVINPITIDDDVFIGSNVPEDDEQEYSVTTAYAESDDVMVATSAANVHKTYECLVAQNAGLIADLLDEDCGDISDWTDSDTGVGGGVSEVSPAGQFRFDTKTSAAGNYVASRSRIIAGSPPNQFTIEIKTYFDAIGDNASGDYFFIRYASIGWRFLAHFCSDGLFIAKAGLVLGEVGSDIVKCNANAAWQTWRFQVDKTVESAATVEVFKKEEGGEFVSQGTFDCDYEIASSDGLFTMAQGGYDTDNRISHVDYVKIATGLGQIATVGNSPVGNTNWLKVDSTNRWKVFNDVIGSQTEQATKIEYIIKPGETFDSLALLNMTSDTVDIVVCDMANDLIINGKHWGGATGTTQPTLWDKVGTPADFSIWSGSIRITSDAANEGMSQTIAVTAGTEYQLCGLYKNTSGDVAQYAIYDVTHSADIVAATDLPDATDFSSFSKVFTTPAGCTSIKISLLAKTAGDIVWFDSIVCAPTSHSETVTTGTNIKSVNKTDIPGTTTSLITLTANKSGTVKIGELIVGNKTYIGVGPLEDAQGGFTNYSDFSENQFGEIELVPRSYSKKLSFDVDIDYADIDSIYDFLCEQKDTMMLYLGSETYGALQIYGFCKEPVITYHSTYCTMALEIRGVI